jgi:hypothetical protein
MSYGKFLIFEKIITMRQLLLIATFLVAGVFNAQQTDQQKLMSILDMSVKNVGNPQKIDSLITEAEKLRSSDDAGVRIMFSQTIDVLKSAKNSSFTAKPLKTDFTLLDKDFQKNFRKNDDKFKETSFIKIKTYLRNRIIPYISIKNGVVRLRLTTEYIGSGWLFFTKAIFNIDGKNYEYNVDDTPDREVRSGGTVQEYSDDIIDETKLIVLKAIVDSKNTVEYRLSGEKYQDFKLTEKDKEAISLVLTLYDKLTQ